LSIASASDRVKAGEQYLKTRINARSLTGLIVLVNTLAGCSQPPPPAASYPLAAPPAPAEPRPAGSTPERCGLVRRARSTWVGFGPGMTMDDMMPAGYAAAEVVRALDAAVCGLLQRGQPIAVLQPHGPQLKLQAADGGGFEVTRVMWQDAELVRASVELRSLRERSTQVWLANVARRAEADGFRIESFGRSTQTQ
jgi:hypothetical protein